MSGFGSAVEKTVGGAKGGKDEKFSFGFEQDWGVQVGVGSAIEVSEMRQTEAGLRWFNWNICC